MILIVRHNPVQEFQNPLQIDELMYNILKIFRDLSWILGF